MHELTRCKKTQRDSTFTSRIYVLVKALLNHIWNLLCTDKCYKKASVMFWHSSSCLIDPLLLFILRPYCQTNGELKVYFKISPQCTLSLVSFKKHRNHWWLSSLAKVESAKPFHFYTIAIMRPILCVLPSDKGPCWSVFLSASVLRCLLQC